MARLLESVLTRRRAPALVLALTLSSIVSCRYPATSVLFVLGSDAPAERTIRVEAKVWRVGEAEPQTATAFSRTGLTEDGEDLFSVVPNGEPRSQRVQVRLEALLSATPTEPTQVLRRILRFSFTPNVTTYQRVFFAMACLNPSTDCQRTTGTCTVQEACEERGQTCGDNGECVPIDVMPQPVPDGGLVRDASARDATVRDARTDSGPDSGAPVDGGIDVVADSPADAAADSTDDSAVDSMVSVGIDARADTGVDAPSDTRIDALTDTGIDARTDTGVDASTDTGIDVRTDTGVDVRTDTGVDVRTDTGVDSGVVPTVGPTDYLMVAFGNVTCARSIANQRSFCWGIGGQGRTALGTTANVFTPTLTVLPDRLVAAAGGFLHTCFITRTAGMVNEVRCFGASSSGQCGIVSPAVMTGNLVTVSNAAMIASGSDHTCIVTGGSDVYCWGVGSLGQLGDGVMRASSATPVQTSAPWGAASIVDIDADSNSSCVLTGGGDVYCWGAGYGTVPTRQMVSGMRGVAVGNSHVCAFNGSGQLYCWGQNNSGQIGDGTTTARPMPTLVNVGGSNVRSVAAGSNTTCAISATGSLYCWGDSSNGKVGNGTPMRSVLSPALITIGGAAVSVTTGAAHTCARAMSGAVHCWGLNNTGQLGLGVGSMMQYSTPQRVPGT
jgi:alpha-tubulin suppressor-like RCC1 family protein